MKEKAMRKMKGMTVAGIRRRLRVILEDAETRRGRAFALFIQALIFLSLLGFALDTLPGLPGWAHAFLGAFEVFVILVFTIEYLLRIWVAEKPGHYILSFFGLVDLIAILPFWLGLGDMLVLRTLRFLRLVRLLKIMRYTRALDRFGRALLIVREEIVVFFALTSLLIFLAAAGIWHFEHEAQPDKFASVFHSLWWAVVTLTTVGYGDVFPVTLGGRIFTALILLLGISLVTVPAGLVASAFQEERRREREYKKYLKKKKKKKGKKPKPRRTPPRKVRKS